MPAALAPHPGLAFLRELSADVTAAVLLDAAGERLAGPAALPAPARDLLAAAPPRPAGPHRAPPRRVPPAPPPRPGPPPPRPPAHAGDAHRRAPRHAIGGGADRGAAGRRRAPAG